MGRFLKNLLKNAAGAMGDSLTPRDYRLDRNGFATDAARLRGDFAAVGRDLRKTLKPSSAAGSARRKRPRSSRRPRRR